MNLTKREILGYLVAGLVTIGGTAAGAKGLATSSDVSERVKVLEVHRESDSKRLERMELKIGQLIDRR